MDKNQIIAQKGDRLRSVAIYFSPSDNIGKFVARGFNLYPGNPIPEPEKHCKVSESLEGARQHVPRGMVNIGRMPEDNVSLVEVWI